jgi:hypothetical protein
VNFGVSFDLLPDILERALGRGIDRVSNLGPFDRNPRHVLVELIADAHATTPSL